MDAAEPVKSRESEGGAAGISFAEYRSHLLALEQEQRQNKQDAVLQSANFMSLVITFVFLFEMDFIAGAFPSTVSSIEYSRYSSCLSVLMFANGLLVLALALLLKVIDCVRPRIPELKDGFSSVDETTPREDLAEREMQLRRDINEAARENLEAASEVISRARHCTLGGMMVGALSAMVFIVNGKLLNVVVKDLQGNGSLLLPDWAWTLLGFISLLLCFFAYFWATSRIRELVPESKSGTGLASYALWLFGCICSIPSHFGRKDKSPANASENQSSGVARPNGESTGSN